MSGHIRSIVPQRGGVAPMDNDTIFFAPFEEHANDVIGGAKHIGNKSSLAFDGVATYVDIGNPGLSSLTSCTIEFWCKTNSVANWLLLRGQDNSKYLMAITTASFYHSSAADPVIYRDGEVVTTLLRDGNWHHYAAVGVNLSTWTTATIGGYPSYQIHGSLEGVRIWNRVLTQAEIRTLAKEGLSHENVNGLITHWKLNEGEGSLAFDYSSNGHDGIIAGGIWTEGRSIYSLGENGLLLEEGTKNYLSEGLLGKTGTKQASSWMGGLVDTGILNEGYPIFYFDGTTITYVYTSDEVLDDDLATLSNKTVVFSVYMRSTNGSTDAQIKIYDDITSYTTLNVSTTAEFKRYEIKKTLGVNPTRLFVMVDGGGQYEFYKPQLEEKAYSTSFVDGVRSNSNLTYPSKLIERAEGTINFWHLKKKPQSAIINQTTSPKLLQVGKYYSSSSLTLWDFNYVASVSSVLVLYIKGQSGSDWSGVASSNYQLNENEWNMITVRWVGRSYSVYVNGSVISTTTSSEDVGPFDGGLIHLGGEGGATTELGMASFNELRIDKVARKPEEILAWYYQGRSG